MTEWVNEQSRSSLGERHFHVFLKLTAKRTIEAVAQLFVASRQGKRRWKSITSSFSFHPWYADMCLGWKFESNRLSSCQYELPSSCKVLRPSGLVDWEGNCLGTIRAASKLLSERDQSETGDRYEYLECPCIHGACCCWIEGTPVLSRSRRDRNNRMTFALPSRDIFIIETND